MDKEILPTHNQLPNGMELHPRKMAMKISVCYAILGWAWILVSDHGVSYLANDFETMIVINSAKGSLFILLTATILFFLVYSQFQAVRRAQTEYIQSVNELGIAHEALTASEEELRQQFDELSAKTILIDEKDQEMWFLFENLHDALSVHEIILDDQGTVVDYRFLIVNLACEKLFGRSKYEMVGHCVTEILPGLEPEFIKICGEVALTRVTKKLNVFAKRFSKHLSISIYSPRYRQFAILATDITEEKMHERTVERLAFYDRLTGLPNRVKLTEILEHALIEENGATSAGTLLYIDMDDLKLVNDSYGHSYGDAMIITAAMHLVSLVESGSTVARVGGDEFVVLIPGTPDPEEMERVALTFVDALSREYEVKDLRFHASASIGVVIYPQDGVTVEDLLRNADTALYEAKRSGKRCWRFFRQAMQETAYGNMLLINGLRNAIAKNELEVYYQPQISLSTGKVTGFEALLRWHSKMHGNVSPTQFIPLAEKSYLIEEIGSWVMRQACAFSRTLAQKGYLDLKIAVNVSPRQLVAADFIEIVRNAFDNAELEASHLEIEITENTFIESMEDSICKLQDLHRLGVHLSLDDFGTGYSSLTYLRSLPVQTVKLDKSFIDLISVEQERSALLASIIDMAHILGLSVIAEGVETAAQLERLIQCRCDMVQGYLVSKAIPPCEALEFLLDDTWKDRIMHSCETIQNEGK